MVVRDMMEIQYLGQNGFRISLDGIVLYFDLYLSDCVYELTGTGIRNYLPPVCAETIPDADYYFISHEHLDHLDPQTVRKVSTASPGVVFICPLPHIHILTELDIPENRIIGAEAYKNISLKSKSGNIDVIPIPEKHEEYNVIYGSHGTLGYVVKAASKQFYHAGDVIADKKLAEDLKVFGKMDVMFVPINGHDWLRFENDIMGNMNYREALDLCHHVGTELVIPMHYDLFNNNTENPGFFVDYLYRNYMGQKFKMFMPGEIMVLK